MELPVCKTLGGLLLLYIKHTNVNVCWVGQKGHLPEQLTSAHEVPSHLHHFIELWVDLLLGLLQDLNELLGLLGVSRGEERVGGASSLGTSSSANAVHIVLSVVGEVQVDDILDIRHIYTKSHYY